MSSQAQLFSGSEERTKRTGRMGDQPKPSVQWVTYECGYCGHRGGCLVGHWECVMCTCGKIWWALQPKRGGPLVGFPWPGRFAIEENPV